MRLARFIAEGMPFESLGLVLGDKVIDLVRAYYKRLLDKGVSEDVALQEANYFLESSRNFTKVWYELKNLVNDVINDKEAIEHYAFDINNVRFTPPIKEPSKIIGVALNYRDHAEEIKREIPDKPMIFFKTPNALIGHNDPIIIPKHVNQVDYEAELVVVVSKKGKNIPVDRAMEFVLGYTIGNDVSARDIQFGFRGHTMHSWGKSFDTFAPIGPWIVTVDEIPNPDNLKIKLELNGEIMQDSSTSNMIFKINELVSYISRGITLEPGDIIFTGTPAGVGAARTPPRFLKKGDRIRIEVERIGVLENHVEKEGEILDFW